MNGFYCEHQVPASLRKVTAELYNRKVSLAILRLQKLEQIHAVRHFLQR